MIEIMCEPQPRPAIPAVLRLRARYRGRRADYARDKLRRNQQMGWFRRPTMGDRLDAAAEKKFRREQTALELEEEKAERRAEGIERRRRRHEVDGGAPYNGSRAQRSHQRHGR